MSNFNPWLLPDGFPSSSHDAFDLQLGQSVALTVLIRRTPRLAVIATSFIAYPNGFTFLLHLVQRRAPTQRALGAPNKGGFHLGASSFRLRLRAEATDGRILETKPDEIGHGGLGWTSCRYLVLSLPPPGQVSFLLDWPDRRAAGVRAEFDATPLLRAAARAKALWPYD